MMFCYEIGFPEVLLRGDDKRHKFVLPEKNNEHYGTVIIVPTSLCRYSTVAYHKILLKNKSAKNKRKRNVCLQVLFSLAKRRLTGEQGKVRRIVIFVIILACIQYVSTNPRQGGREQYYRMDNGLGADDEKKTLADKLQVASITNCSS